MGVERGSGRAQRQVANELAEGNALDVDLHRLEFTARSLPQNGRAFDDDIDRMLGLERERLPHLIGDQCRSLLSRERLGDHGDDHEHNDDAEHDEPDDETGPAARWGGRLDHDRLGRGGRSLDKLFVAHDYILSGAETPMSVRPLRNTCPAASLSHRRALCTGCTGSSPCGATRHVSYQR